MSRGCCLARLRKALSMTYPHDARTSDLLDRLRAGASPAQACQALSLSPMELVSALGDAALGPNDPAVWPGLTQARPRRPWLAPALSEPAWAEVFPRATRPARLALAAGL